MKYEELGEEFDDVGEEWNKYKEALVGNAEEHYGRSTCMGGGGARKKARTVDNRSRISNKNIYHMVRLKDETLAKKSETNKQEDCRKRGRPRLSWED